MIQIIISMLYKYDDHYCHDRDDYVFYVSWDTYVAMHDTRIIISSNVYERVLFNWYPATLIVSRVCSLN